MTPDKNRQHEWRPVPKGEYAHGGEGTQVKLDGARPKPCSRSIEDLLRMRLIYDSEKMKNYCPRCRWDLFAHETIR